MTDNLQNNDAAYWSGLKKSDPEALGSLYDKYVDKLFISAMHTTDNRELAKDSVQEVFIEIWNYRHTITEVQYSLSYLAKVLRSILLKKLKKEHTSTHLPLEESFVSPEYTIENILILQDSERENKKRLKLAMTKLSNRQKEVLDLHFHQGLSYEQIAEVMSINYQSVNNLAFRSILRLRNLMICVLICISFIITY